MKRHWDRYRSIHSYHSNSYLLNESSRRRTVAGKYRGSVPVFMIIYQLDCLPNIADTYHAENRAKNLFPVNAHFRSDMIKQGTTEKESFTVFCHGSIAAVHNETGSLFHAEFHIGFHSRQRSGSHKRPHLDAVSIPRSDL